MITIIPRMDTVHIGTCNACRERKAAAEIKFKDSYNAGGTVIALCESCIKELQCVLNAIEITEDEK